MKIKFHHTVQNTTYYTYRKLNTSRDRSTLLSHDPCWGAETGGRDLSSKA